jgi:hypothetical protein
VAGRLGLDDYVADAAPLQVVAHRQARLPAADDGYREVPAVEAFSDTAYRGAEPLPAVHEQKYRGPTLPNCFIRKSRPLHGLANETKIIRWDVLGGGNPLVAPVSAGSWKTFGVITPNCSATIAGPTRPPNDETAGPGDRVRRFGWSVVT